MKVVKIEFEDGVYCFSREKAVEVAMRKLCHEKGWQGVELVCINFEKRLQESDAKLIQELHYANYNDVHEHLTPTPLHDGIMDYFSFEEQWQNAIKWISELEEKDDNNSLTNLGF
jgi:uncharacterized protein (UPF0262 family)